MSRLIRDCCHEHRHFSFRSPDNYLGHRPGSSFAVLWRAPLIVFSFACLLVMFASHAEILAASHYETELLYFEGKYAECEQIAQQEVDRGVWNELWPELLIKALMTQGKYEEAAAAYSNSARRYSDRIGYRYLGAQVHRMVDKPLQANRELAEIVPLVRRAPWRFSSARDQVILGKYFLDEGEDAKQVLEVVYDRVRKQSPRYPDVYLATAELALEKHDHALAAEQLKVAAELQPSNPQVFYLQARAMREQDPSAASASLRKAISLNPHHVPSLLLMVDQAIDEEAYDRAESLLTEVLTVNPRHPTAWAYHAVIAHLQGHYEGEAELREVALAPWSTNPEVDHLIGKKLSQKYRFREGAAYQRKAIKNRTDFAAARFQLAQDLLRLGEDSEGWELASQVHQDDGYHVVAYNLVTLKEQLDKFQTLQSDHFVVRMDAREARIYGQQVLELLEEAHAVLCPKYDVQLEGMTYVEIFPRQEDFAIRTFGLPGGAGYLGVCFGRLITANSPASQGTTPSNWKAVLWHEFCHVVTLQKTQNRMPRWLSEGISVYEERQREPSWGQRLTPRFREMILGEELTPVSQLSGAFLRPPSGQHLQFAYYESSLVVEFLLERVGNDGLRKILVDLSVGMPIEESLTRYLGNLKLVDDEFAAFARDHAKTLAPQLDWTAGLVTEEVAASEAGLRQVLAEYPNHYEAAATLAQRYIDAERWEEAEAILAPIHSMFPSDARTARLLARCYRELAQTDEERTVLQRLAVVDADAFDSFERLAELAAETDAWDEVRQRAEQMASVNPLQKVAQTWLAKAAEELNDADISIAAHSALLEMDPADPAALYLRLAQAHAERGDTRLAKRRVLQALEEAPRYRDAHHLLLKVKRQESESTAESESTVLADEGDTDTATDSATARAQPLGETETNDTEDGQGADGRGRASR
jgi:tetratricopeptide (TPR) repeat protein